MGQFKPMTKMMTTEPSVILKLKKGGHVAMKPKLEEGFKAMNARNDDMAEEGCAPKKPSMSSRMKAMNPNQYAKGGSAKHEDAAQDRAMIKKALAGKKFAAGGAAIDAAETKTTLKNSVKPFAKTKMHDGDKTDKAHGTKGVKEGKPAGYKAGGNVSKFANTKMVDGDKADKAHGTKGVKEGKPAGYKRGGTPGIGRAIEGNEGKFTNGNVDDGDKFDPAHGTKGVRESNAGGYKKGGSTKKAYATGGNVVDDGKAVAMPRKPVSRPVANSLQSGTFKKGGKVGKYAEGDVVDAKAVSDKASRELEEALNPLSMAKELYGKARNYFRGESKVPGAVTKTKESVTVAPKKRGGSAK